MIKAVIRNLERSKDAQQINLEVDYLNEDNTVIANRVFTIGDLDRIKEGEEQQFINEFVKKEGQTYNTTLDVEDRLIKTIEIGKEIEI